MLCNFPYILCSLSIHGTCRPYMYTNIFHCRGKMAPHVSEVRCYVLAAKPCIQNLTEVRALWNSLVKARWGIILAFSSVHKGSRDMYWRIWEPKLGNLMRGTSLCAFFTTKWRLPGTSYLQKDELLDRLCFFWAIWHGTSKCNHFNESTSLIMYNAGLTDI